MDETAGHHEYPRLYINAFGDDELIPHDRIYTVGRGSSVDLPLLDDDCVTYSRKTLQFAFSNDSWTVTNCGRYMSVSCISLAPNGRRRQMTLEPTSSLVLIATNYRFCFNIPGEIHPYDLLVRVEQQQQAESADSAAVLPKGVETLTVTELSEHDRRLAAAVLQPRLENPALPESAINTNPEAARLAGVGPKAMEHLVVDLKEPVSYTHLRAHETS